VGLAQAILHNPDVLVLDEPTAGLDPKQIIETRELIKELAGTHTIILSTHILPEVAQTCQRVVIINKGRVVAVDSVENLTARAGASAVVSVEVDAGGQDVRPVLGAVQGVARVELAGAEGSIARLDIHPEDGRDVRREIAAAVVARGWGLLELRQARMSLEDVFLNLTTQEEPVATAAPEAADA
jgi:ABC-2 type transport system ATP-binding protein